MGWFNSNTTKLFIYFIFRFPPAPWLCRAATYFLPFNTDNKNKKIKNGFFVCLLRHVKWFACLSFRFQETHTSPGRQRKKSYTSRHIRMMCSFHESVSFTIECFNKKQKKFKSINLICTWIDVLRSCADPLDTNWNQAKTQLPAVWRKSDGFAVTYIGMRIKAVCAIYMM